MADSLYAGKAVVGKQYVTKGGFPVTVLEIGKRVTVRSDLFSGKKLDLYLDQLLWPYSKSLISKEAIQMANATKSSSKKSGNGNGSRGGERGAKEVAGGFMIYRHHKGSMQEVVLKKGVLVFKDKEYTTLSDVATALAGKKVPYPYSFFGLKTEPFIGLGKDIKKELSAAEDARKKEEKAAALAARKAKAKKADDEDEDDGKKTKVSDVVAKVFGKGRK